MAVRRVYVEKKEGFRVEADGLYQDLKENLQIEGLASVRILHRYDLDNISDATYEHAVTRILSEPPVDDVYEETAPYDPDDFIFAVEYLPGQYDQRSDSAMQCIKLLAAHEEPEVAYAKVYVLTGTLTDAEKTAVKEYCINAVDSREAALEKPETLKAEYGVPDDVAVLTGFTAMSAEELEQVRSSMGLAMSSADILFTQDYYRDTEHRDPSVTEIRVLDTYWSDHCRHTTFGTILTDVQFGSSPLLAPVKASYEDYLAARRELGREDKPLCLMDLALAAMRRLKKEGKLTDQEETYEINACSIVLPVDVDGKTAEWLLMFKNETHNHPTEIEPFGGAATCLGGAIRDPLSGRSYVYQAMRITGGADPTVPVGDTIPGKLPQRKLARQAARGYSSYGNQIGLATGYVKEIYHPGYMAKHMELGAVIAAAPRKNVVRGQALPGDVVILLGGDTGRDGIGGATGSSKVHTEESIHTCGAEVQKGNPPTERKIQRLFRNPDASSLIKVCNDFGAGGVCVAIGELADGLDINLDLVPKKYAGLDGTELAISESQERMAVVVAPQDADAFLKLAGEENLNAVQVAVVTESPRLVMHWRGKTIVDLSRAFIGTNGAPAYAEAEVADPKAQPDPSLPERQAGKPFAEQVKSIMSDLNVASQQGLVEMFDSTIGASTVLTPYGGATQLTPIQTMACKLPVEGETKTASLMAYGFDPYLTEWSPYHGAMAAVVESAARIVAAGGQLHKIHLTFQEYFERMTSKESWGKPLAALLGAYRAQMELGLASIGGKDSMSGSFDEMHVPPTLISLAVAAASTDDILTPEMKEAGDAAVLLELPVGEDGVYDFARMQELFTLVEKGIRNGQIKAAYTVACGGVTEAIVKMCLGNRLGFRFDKSAEKLLTARPVYGSMVLEIRKGTPADVFGQFLGVVTDDAQFRLGMEFISFEDVLKAYQERLEKVYPTEVRGDQGRVGEVSLCTEKPHIYTGNPLAARPRVFIPVFPGTNCEYDTARAFRMAGAEPDVYVLRNLTGADILESVDEMVRRINKAQILMIPGGFSAGDEPEGSGKFIATVFSNEKIREAVMELLGQRDGLALGICNGFQALIKLGLVPYGEIRELAAGDPTLTYNTIGRHVSHMATTRVVSSKSPWLAGTRPGDVHTIPVSHGEGRFYASEEVLRKLAANGQIATQYVDPQGQPTMDIRYNPNGSLWAIEGITSPDGRVLGKMGHSERRGDNVLKNVPGDKDQHLFASGVAYFG